MTSPSFTSCPKFCNRVIQYRSFPGGAVEDGNAFMAAELLAKLVPSTEGDAKAIALRTVEEMKDEVLRLEPALLVQLNRANGEDLAVKATKVNRVAPRWPHRVSPCAVEASGDREEVRV